MSSTISSSDYIDSEEAFQTILQKLSSSQDTEIHRESVAQSVETFSPPKTFVRNERPETQPSISKENVSISDFSPPPRKRSLSIDSVEDFSIPKPRPQPVNLEQGTPSETLLLKGVEADRPNQPSSHPEANSSADLKEQRKSEKLKKEAEKTQRKEERERMKAEKTREKQEKAVERENSSRITKGKAELHHVTCIHSTVFDLFRDDPNALSLSQLMAAEYGRVGNSKDQLVFREYLCGTPNTVTFIRKERTMEGEKEIDCDQVLYVMDRAEFVGHVGSDTLLATCRSIRATVDEEKYLTLVVVGMDPYFEELEQMRKKKDNRKKNVQPDLTSYPILSRLNSQGNRLVSKDEVESAMIQVQMELEMQECFPSSLEQFAADLKCFHRSVSHERAKLKTITSAGYGIDKEVAKVDPNASDAEIFKQVLLLVDPKINSPIADAIVERFGSPRELWKALEATGKDLLSEVSFHNGRGKATERTRRIGPAASQKVHLAFTSREGSEILQEPPGSKSRALVAPFVE